MIVDEYQNTRVPNIHSLGDCCGKWELTPVAIAARFRSFILHHLSRFRKIHPIIAHICRSSSPVSQSDTEFDLLSPAKISRIGSEPLFLTAEGVLRPGNTLSLSSKLNTKFHERPWNTLETGLTFSCTPTSKRWLVCTTSQWLSIFLQSYFGWLLSIFRPPVGGLLPSKFPEPRSPSMVTVESMLDFFTCCSNNRSVGLSSPQSISFSILNTFLLPVLVSFGDGAFCNSSFIFCSNLTGSFLGSVGVFLAGEDPMKFSSKSSKSLGSDILSATRYSKFQDEIIESRLWNTQNSFKNATGIIAMPSLQLLNFESKRLKIYIAHRVSKRNLLPDKSDQLLYVRWHVTLFHQWLQQDFVHVWSLFGK